MSPEAMKRFVLPNQSGDRSTTTRATETCIEGELLRAVGGDMRDDPRVIPGNRVEVEGDASGCPFDFQ